ncbi:MAG: hypothetical protein ACI8O8_001423 [Oleiphilaceae bacterium]|jgi:hypothetical protein
MKMLKSWMLFKQNLKVKGLGSSGNRVGALRVLNSFKQNGDDVDTAIDDGKRWGLTKLVIFVRDKLSQ